MTAEGQVDAFPAAETLISLAPRIREWSFIALKPAMGFDFNTRYEGTLFEPERMWFLPLAIADQPQSLGIRVGIEGLKMIEERVAHNAVLVILDTALGERSAAVDIQHIEITELPPQPGELGYIELPELADYIAWRKKKLMQH